MKKVYYSTMSLPDEISAESIFVFILNEAARAKDRGCDTIVFKNVYGLDIYDPDDDLSYNPELRDRITYLLINYGYSIRLMQDGIHKYIEIDIS